MTGFASEAAMVKEWLAMMRGRSGHANKDWTVYPETAGWDLLLVHRDGFQIGIEAKLSLNAKVLAQSLSGTSNYYTDDGPDYRAVLVPAGKMQQSLGALARAVGIFVLTAHPPGDGYYHHAHLPDQSSKHSQSWPTWMPGRRCPLPAYVPDVAAGCASPVQLTEWKIMAIKLMIVLERRGFVTRRDMKAIGLSPSRWCDHFNGYLGRNADGYCRIDRTPDLRAMHPVNYPEIEADVAVWGAGLDPFGITS